MRHRTPTDRNAWKPPRVLLMSWLALLGLLALTVTFAYLPLGAFNTVAAMMIAAVKAMLIAVIFMELGGSGSLVITFAGAGFYWLAIMFWLAFADFLTRPQSVSTPLGL